MMEFRRILAQMILERTLPAGGAGGSGVAGEIDPLATKYNTATGSTITTYDMQGMMENGWPDERPAIDPTKPNEPGNGWRHNDIREMAYLYVVEEGGLNRETEV